MPSRPSLTTPLHPPPFINTQQTIPIFPNVFRRRKRSKMIFFNGLVKYSVGGQVRTGVDFARAFHR